MNPYMPTSAFKTARLLGLSLVLVANLAPACKSQPPAAEPTVTPTAIPADGAIHVSVNAQGYTPSAISAPAGKPVTLIFRRESDVGCGDEVVFPKQGIRKPLPLNQDVYITITPTGPGEISFTCGMGMYKGAIVIAPS